MLGWDWKWRTPSTAKLPSPRFGLRAATLDNKVFIFGKNIILMRLPHLTSNDINVNRRKGVKNQIPQYHSQLQCKDEYLGARRSYDPAKSMVYNRCHRTYSSAMPLGIKRTIIRGLIYHFTGKIFCLEIYSILAVVSAVPIFSFLLNVLESYVVEPEISHSSFIDC